MNIVTTEKHNVKIENLSLKEFRQRLFVKQSELLYGKTQYENHYVDDVPEQIEALKGFTNWEAFSKTWDVYWVGLDPRAEKWVEGRHHSPIRKLVLPLRILEKDERSGRMLETYLDKADLSNLPVPGKRYEESDEDRAISDSLTGKVVIDEPDEDKAIRLIESTMKDLNNKLALLKGLK